MTITCPSCGQENPGVARFCLACGAQIVESSRSGRKERKTVSVLFCDLVGFTTASEAADPEDVQGRLSDYHELLRRRIESFGGTVEKFIGDAVMAVFGAPLAHEDDPERAVRAALAIIDALAAAFAETLSVRIGIHTGEVVVDLDARPERGEGFVTGDVVNTAARIQAGAPVDAVAVGETTYRATERVFEYLPLEALRAKGKSDPVAIWRPVRARGRLGTDVLDARESPFFGREAERGLLRSIYTRCARDSAVQLVTILGEPGVGKSRLVADLGHYLDDLDDLVTWRQGRCLPYGEGIAFWALGELVKAHAGIYDADPPEQAAGKLAAVLPEGDAHAWLHARLLPLVGVDAGASFAPEESFAAWRRFFEWIAEAGPVVLVIEDIHLGDSGLLEFLAYLAEWASDVPLLLICTARPELYERHSLWAGGIRNATSIDLGPLSPGESRELVGSLLERSDLSERAASVVFESCGGNPLYAEEFVRLLVERAAPGGVSDTSSASPASVQALMAARLDTLSAERKALLQDAAVVGKVFWAGALTRMSGRDSREIEVALHEFSRKQLVRRARVSSLEGEAEYSFWHALLCDVAYQQIPRAERARRHAEFAAWLVERAGEGVGDVADILIHHYERARELAHAAGDLERARTYEHHARGFLIIAARRSARLAPADAVARYAQAIASTDDEDPSRPELLLRMAEALADTGDGSAAADALDRAIEALRASGEIELEAAALGRRAQVAQSRGDARLVEFAAQSVALLAPLPASPALLDAYAGLAAAQLFHGRTAESIETATGAIALAASIGAEPPPRLLGYLGDARVELGDAAGLDQMRQAVDLLSARERAGATDESSSLLVRFLNNLALARVPIEGPGKALPDLERAIALANERGLGELFGVTRATKLTLLFQLGRIAEAEQLAAALGDEARRLNLTVLTASTVAWQTLCCYVRTGRLPEDFALEQLQPLDMYLLSSDIGALVAAVTAVAQRVLGDAPAALRTLDELASTPNLRASWEYPRLLPLLVREAIALGDIELAERARAGVAKLHRLHELALASSAAALSEARGDDADALDRYAHVAAAWMAYGDAPEHAYALHGHARCLRSLGRPNRDVEIASASAFRALGIHLPVDCIATEPWDTAQASAEE